MVKVELPKVTHKAQKLGLKTIQPILPSKKICIKKYHTSVCYFKKGTKFILKKCSLLTISWIQMGQRKCQMRLQEKFTKQQNPTRISRGHNLSNTSHKGSDLMLITKDQTFIFTMNGNAQIALLPKLLSNQLLQVSVEIVHRNLSQKSGFLKSYNVSLFLSSN